MKIHTVMELNVKHYSCLDIYELHKIYKARVDVFVVEQNCPYPELDGLDLDAYHLWLEDDGELVAYLRVLPAGARFDEVSVGRVLSLRRREGHARRLLEAGIECAKREYGAAAIRIEAQTYAAELYRSVGFRQTSEEFLEDGLPHIEMLWEEELPNE